MWSWGINGCSLDSVLGCGLDGIIGCDGWDWFKWIPQIWIDGISVFRGNR